MSFFHSFHFLFLFIFFIYFHLLSVSFIFFHFLSCSFIFYHFPSLLGAQNLFFFLDLNFVTISLDNVKKINFWGPSRVENILKHPFGPPLFFFSSFVFSPVFCLSFFLLFIFHFFLIVCSFLHFFDFLMFFIFLFSEENFFFFFLVFSFKYVFIPGISIRV